jgi:hypothetical protein
VTETATEGTYTATFTVTRVGTVSALTVTVNAVILMAGSKLTAWTTPARYCRLGAHRGSGLPESHRAQPGKWMRLLRLITGGDTPRALGIGRLPTQLPF